MTLNKIYSTSLYGSVLLHAKSLKPISNAWNIAIRSCFNLPRQCHSGIAHLVGRTEDITNFVAKRFLKYAKASQNSKNRVVQHVAITATSDLRTTFGQNLYEHCNEVHVRKYSENEKRIAEQICELKFNTQIREFLGAQNADLVITHICT